MMIEMIVKGIEEILETVKNVVNHVIKIDTVIEVVNDAEIDMMIVSGTIGKNH